MSAIPQPITPGLVRDALAKLPERLHVGPYPLKLKVIPARDKDRHVVWGKFEPDAQTIWLNDEFPSVTFMGMVLTHELLHAIWWAQGVSEEDDKEERIVTLLSTGLTQVYRDNPWLLPWLAECGRFDKRTEENALAAPSKVAAFAKSKKPKAKRDAKRKS